MADSGRIYVRYLLRTSFRQSLNLTVREGLDRLSTLCAHKLSIAGQERCQTIPAPRGDLADLLKLAQVTLPEALPSKGAKVATRKKLAGRRNTR